MARLLEFATHHLALVGAFGAVLLVLLWTLVQSAFNNALSPQRGVLLLNRDGALPIDARMVSAYRVGHIINAVQIEPSAFAEAPAKLEKHKTRPLLVYCDTGTTSAQLARRLRSAGFTQVHVLQGGLATWRSENLPLEKG